MIWPITRTIGLSPFGELRRLQREMNRIFDDAGVDSFPAVNIWSNENEVVLNAELPGVDPKNVDINVLKDQITIEGERKPEELGDEATYHRRERGAGRFIRSFRLPFDVDNEKVNAKYQDGILKITLPRAETSKPRKIEITG